jgi:hypothetical protein
METNNTSQPLLMPNTSWSEAQSLTFLCWPMMAMPKTVEAFPIAPRLN